MKSLIIILLFLLITNFEFLAQTDTTIAGLEEVIEDLIEETDEDVDNSDLFETIEEAVKDKIDINSADLEELLRIPLIDFHSAEAILEHRNKFGKFFSINELYAIQKIPKELTDRIIPFVTIARIDFKEEFAIEDPTLFQSIYYNSRVYFRSRMISDLQLREGFKNERFEGTKLKSYNRLQIRYSDKVRIGFLTDKDPGEKRFDDFTSYHLLVSNAGILKSLAIGDYIIEFGQGLAMWNIYGFSKGADAVTPVKKRARNIIPYTSSTENNFFRGAAASVGLNDFILSAFYSKNKFDANVDEFEGIILSTPLDGLHRTEGELSRKNAGQETLFGGRLDYAPSGRFSTGLLYYKTEYNYPFEPSSLFGRSGSEFNYSSFYYDVIYENFNLAGEFAYNGISAASINHLILRITRDLSLITSIRSYPRNYFALHGFGFGERSGATNNEFGIYNGLRWRTPFGLFNFYYDQFKFPYSTFGNTLPVTGNEYMLDLTSKPFRQLETRVRYKHELREVARVFEDVRRPDNRLRRSIRTELIVSPSRDIRLRGRFEYSHFLLKESGIREEGVLVFQDLRLTTIKDLTFYGRIIFFRTDSFNSAIYEYENDLTGVLTNLAMFGEGVRWYVIARYRLLRTLAVSMKYSETYKPGVSSISSGNTRIDGKLDNRFSLQLDLSL